MRRCDCDGGYVLPPWDKCERCSHAELMRLRLEAMTRREPASIPAHDADRKLMKGGG